MSRRGVFPYPIHDENQDDVLLELAKRAPAEPRPRPRPQPRPLAPVDLSPFEAHDWPAILAKIVEKRKMLGLTQEVLGDLAGVPDGYVGHLEAWVPRGHPNWTRTHRGLGAESIGKILVILGLKLQLVHTDVPKHVFAYAKKAR